MVIKVIVILILEDVTAVDWIVSCKSSCLVLEFSIKSPRLTSKDVVAIVYEEGVITNVNGSVCLSEVDIYTISDVSVVVHSNDQKITLRRLITIFTNDRGILVVFPIWSESKTLNFEKHNNFFSSVIPSNSSGNIIWHFTCESL